MPYGGAGFKGQPSNNIWVGDSYSTMSRNSYPSMNQSSTMNPYMQNQRLVAAIMLQIQFY